MSGQAWCPSTTSGAVRKENFDVITFGRGVYWVDKRVTLLQDTFLRKAFNKYMELIREWSGTYWITYEHGKCIATAQKCLCDVDRKAT